jgi:hypothetical protein
MKSIIRKVSQKTKIAKMEGFNQEFKLAMEEVQELTRRAAMYSSRGNNGPTRIDIKAVQYYRLEVDKRIDYIQEMMGIFPFKTDIFYLWRIHLNTLKLLSMLLNNEDQKDRYQKLNNYVKVLEKFKTETDYSYWKNYISTHENKILEGS